MKKLLFLFVVFSFFFGCKEEVAQPQRIPIVNPVMEYHEGVPSDNGDYQSNLKSELRNMVPHYIGGTHFFTPSYPNFETNSQGGHITFDADAEYDLNDAEQQLDFNKLPGGLRKAWIGSSQKNSGIWGWRWCVEHGTLEYSPFINDKDGGFWCMGHQMVLDEQLTSPREVPIFFEIKNFSNRFEFTIGDRWYVFYKSAYNVKPFSTSYYVNGWMGGDHVAPHDIHLFLNYLILFLFTIRKRKVD